MSGGHFNYSQARILAIIESLQETIQNETSPNPHPRRRSLYGYCEDEEDVDRYNFSKETLDEFKKGLDLLNRAYIYTQRIDWLLCSDDGEESFHKRLKEDLEKYEKTGEI